MATETVLDDFDPIPSVNSAFAGIFYREGWLNPKSSGRAIVRPKDCDECCYRRWKNCPETTCLVAAEGRKK